MLGVSTQAIYNARKKCSIPKSWFVEVGEKAAVSVDWLLTGEGTRTRPIDSALGTDPDTGEWDQKTRVFIGKMDVMAGAIADLVLTNKELKAENRQLVDDNRRLLQENGDLRVELAELKARAAPDTDAAHTARKTG